MILILSKLYLPDLVVLLKPRDLDDVARRLRESHQSHIVDDLSP